MIENLIVKNVHINLIYSCAAHGVLVHHYINHSAATLTAQFTYKNIYDFKCAHIQSKLKWLMQKNKKKKKNWKWYVFFHHSPHIN